MTISLIILMVLDVLWINLPQEMIHSLTNNSECTKEMKVNKQNHQDMNKIPLLYKIITKMQVPLSQQQMWTTN